MYTCVGPEELLDRDSFVRGIFVSLGGVLGIVTNSMFIIIIICIIISIINILLVLLLLLPLLSIFLSLLSLCLL